MERRPLGRTGVQVSQLCLGTVTFGDGGTRDHDESIKIVHRALDAGITFVDLDGTPGALTDLVRAGKIRCLGHSTENPAGNGWAGPALLPAAEPGDHVSSWS
ncbi:aldo/keto reductase [Actinoplanes sp. NPDC048967]|uniref:aldo/keto reductase n=1 Tax=Actinoplanes sp. NPDC048967 TaxID=3155269 RepID=UPI0033DE8D57